MPSGFSKRCCLMRADFFYEICISSGCIIADWFWSCHAMPYASGCVDRGRGRLLISCRDHPGNLVDLIRRRGYFTSILSLQDALVSCPQNGDGCPTLAHEHWLGSSQEQDALECLDFIKEVKVDWLIVDHYALDKRWEKLLKPVCENLMVIDDLADRDHECDLLLDQTFRRRSVDYDLRVPRDCQLLCGANYALLRPEFLSFRPHSLSRRSRPQISRILITMGGVDKDNVTGRILSALCYCAVPVGCKVIVVMGAAAPWLDDVRQLVSRMPYQAEVFIDVSNMAELMAGSDLSIGAAGATAWERCCLGLPSVMAVLADNQKFAAKLLEESGAALLLTIDDFLVLRLNLLLAMLTYNKRSLRLLCENASKVTDGKGCMRVVDRLINEVAR